MQPAAISQSDASFNEGVIVTPEKILSPKWNNANELHQESSKIHAMWLNRENYKNVKIWKIHEPNSNENISQLWKNSDQVISQSLGIN